MWSLIVAVITPAPAPSLACRVSRQPPGQGQGCASNAQAAQVTDRLGIWVRVLLGTEHSDPNCPGWVVETQYLLCEMCPQPNNQGRPCWGNQVLFLLFFFFFLIKMEVENPILLQTGSPRAPSTVLLGNGPQIEDSRQEPACLGSVCFGCCWVWCLRWEKGASLIGKRNRLSGVKAKRRL